MDYTIHIAILCGIASILGLSSNLAIGYAGLPVLHHIAFAGVGAYTSSIVTIRADLSPWIGIAVGAAVAGASAALLGRLALRVRDDNFALATFAIAVVVYSLIKNLGGVTRGPLGLSGIPRPRLLGFSMSNDASYALFVALVLGVTWLILWRITESPFGRVLKAIRDDELAAAGLGKDTQRYRLVVLAVAGFFAGVAGALYAHYAGFIDPSSFSPMESVLVLLMVVFGGMASLPGSAVGAVSITLLPELLRFVGLPNAVAAQTRQMIYGLLLVLVVLIRPQGLLGRFRY